MADGSGHVKQGSDLVDDHALRRLFHALERHRRLERHGHQLVLRGSHSRRPGRRYENLLVAAAVDRLQRDCLRGITDSEGGRSEVERVLLAEVEQELQDHERGSEQLRGWLPWIVRRRAEPRARKRFEAIVAEVTTEVGGEVPAIMILGQSVPDEPAVFGPSTDQGAREAEGEPKLEPAAEPSRCTVLTRRGTRCRNQAETGRLCELHARIAAGPVPAAAPEGTSDGVAPEHRDSEGIHADTVWAVAGFVLVAAVLAWAGMPVSEDAPVGSRVVVGEAAAPPTTGPSAESLVAQLHRSRAGDGSGRDDRAGGPHGDPQSEDSIDVGAAMSVSPGGAAATAVAISDRAPAAPAPAPDPDPDPGTDGTSNGDAGGNPPTAGGRGGQAEAVRGELVDQMLGVPGR